MAIDNLGVQVHGLWDVYWPDGAPRGELPRHLDAVADMGASSIRVDVGWSAAEPSRPSTEDSGSLDRLKVGYYLQRLEGLLSLCEERRLEVLVTLHQSPPWSRGSLTGGVKHFPGDLVAWESFVRRFTSVFGSRVFAIEVWNEPNLSEFTGLSSELSASERAARYVPVLAAASRGVRAASGGVGSLLPAAPLVVFGGPAQTDAAFIDACYWFGARDLFDVLSWHPYQGDQRVSPLSTDQYAKYRATYAPRVLEHMAFHGDATKPVWWSEFGVSVHSNAGVKEVWRHGVESEAAAALRLVEYFELSERYPQVEAGFVYAAYRGAYDVHTAGYSILEASGGPREQASALSALFGGSL